MRVEYSQKELAESSKKLDAIVRLCHPEWLPNLIEYAGRNSDPDLPFHVKMWLWNDIDFLSHELYGEFCAKPHTQTTQSWWTEHIADIARCSDNDLVHEALSEYLTS